jgi:geranylgeranyl diphosphate synthase type I
MTALPTDGAAGSVAWLDALRRRCGTDVHAFVTERVREHFTGHAADTPAPTVLPEFVTGGKFLRPMFAYTGWRCGGPESAAALRAAASLELLHCFALAQDDVMDGSARRRGRPSMHVRFTRWHEEQGLSGSAARFGESAAVLMGDLFLVWSEQLLHESGLDAGAVARWRELITATGARDQLEKFIDDRVRRALEAIDLVSLPRQAASALTALANRCTERVR